MTKRHLAIDIGASSGRATLGAVKDGRLCITETDRFANEPVLVDGTLRWNFPQLCADIHRSVSRQIGEIDSVGVDTWAVDFGLLDEGGNLIELPYHYRDHRTIGMMDQVFERVPRREIYDRTGIQFLPFNTLYQLFACFQSTGETQRLAKKFTMIPDLLMADLSGKKHPGCERSNATTTQLFNPLTQAWDFDLAERLSIPTCLFPDVIPSGTVTGTYPGSSIQVMAPVTHDTGSAVVAVPSDSGTSAWLSTGTWSILGIETAEAVINDDTFTFGLTNEGGYGTNRLSRNVMGFWIIQECRKELTASGTSIDFPEIAQLAADAPPAHSFIDPDCPSFLAPANMITAIKEYLVRTGQSVPQDLPQLFRLVYESLALKYRTVLDKLQPFASGRISCLHVIGGGSQDRFMNQLTANVCQVPVIAGPVEASSIGNILVQMIGSGSLAGISEARELVRNSFPTESFLPQDGIAPDREKQFNQLIQTAL